MTDYKDYIVRYDIQASTQNAAIGLRELIGLADKLQGPMNIVAESIQQVSSSITQLQRNAHLVFEPQIAPQKFNQQLNVMLRQVRQTAAQMHAAIYEALSGNPLGTKAAQTGIGKGFQLAKGVQGLKSQLDSNQKLIQEQVDRINGLQKTLRTKLTESQRTNAERSLAQARTFRDGLRLQQKEIRAALQDAEETEKAAAAAAKKTQTTAQKTASTTTSKTAKTTGSKTATQARPMTNVTPAIIREWGKVFGSQTMKNMTVNIKGNATGANGALTIIGQVQTALKELQGFATFEIAPGLNNAAFTAAENKLRELAGLSAAVVAPFASGGGKTLTKTEKTKLADARQQVVAVNEKIAKVQSRLAANQAKYAATPTPALKGQITKDTNLLTTLQADKTKAEDIVTSLAGKGKTTGTTSATIPVGVKIMTDNIAASIKAITPPPISVPVKLVWAKGSSLNQQLKTKTKGLKPINLDLNTTPAIEKLEAFIAEIKAKSPQTITLTATGAAGTGAGAGTGGKTGRTGTGKGKGTTGAMPLTPKQYVDQLGKHLGKGFSLPSNYATQIADRQRTRAWHLDQMRRDAMTAFAQKTPYELAEEERLRKLAPTTAGTGKGKVVWGSQRPTIAPAKGMKWVANNNLENFLSTEQKQELARLQGIQTAAAQNVRAMQSQIAQSRSKINSRLSTAQTQYNALEQQLAPWRTQIAQLEEMKKPLLSLKKLNAVQKKGLAAITSAQAPIAAQISQLEAQQAPFAATIQYQTALMSRYNAMASRAMAAAHSQHSQASAAVGRYTDGWSQVPIYGTPSAENVAKAQALRAQFHNSLLPFGLNKSQMDIVKQYRQFFKRGAMISGITPVAGMQAAQMMQYLQAVSMQMQAANVPVPIQLRNYMNKLEKSMAGGGAIPYGNSGRASAMPRQMSYFDRARKWAYPFTGTTSFGQRTPMAVDMAKGMGVMFAIGGAMSAIGSSFSQAMEYQNTMKTTQAILQNGTSSYSQSNFRNMEELVREVGIKTKFSAPEVANAARFLGMAGFDINAINHSIRPIADLALIGDLDLGETADKMTNIMTTFGIKPELMRDAANIMTSTATRSNTDLMMLAESAKYGGGMARLYGSSRENPLENFAETMAIFGVMGNAGVQGSSAGTALRMMYMNLFNPNKRQQSVHEKLLTDYGISMYADEAKTKRRSMADIIMDMAAKIPQEQMADLVSKLFRITATSGASAVLQAAEVDPNMAQQTLEENEAIVKQLTKGNQFSQLASLIKANVESIGGNVSGSIAEEKQNTIQGLWAQVTSTFTEGVVQAFENRQGGFESMLKGLRDYLAKPETITMIQNLLDMVIEIGKVLAWVVELWAKIYSAFPGFIQLWVKWQMIFTQVGTFITPIVQLMGAFNRLGGVIGWLTGVTATGAGSVAARAAGGDAAMMAPLLLGAGTGGKGLSIQGNLAARARQDFANNAMAAQAIAMTGGNFAAEKTRLDKATTAHYQAVTERHRRMYSPKNMWKRLPKNMWGNIVKGTTTTFSWVSMSAGLSSLFGGVTKLFTGLFSALAKAIGLLFNPITLTIGAAVGLGYGLYQLKKRIDGTTEAQIRSRKEAQAAISQTVTQLNQQGEWHRSILTEGMPNPIKVISSTQKEKIANYVQARQNFQSTYGVLFKDWDKDASEQSISDVAKSWRQMIMINNQNRLAIGGRLANLTDKGLKTYTEKYLPYQNQVNPSLATSLVAANSKDAAVNGLVEAIVNRWHMDEGYAKELRDEMMVQALMMEGGNSPVIQKAISELVNLKKKVLAKDINPDTKKPYDQAYFTSRAQEIRQQVLSQWPVSLASTDLTIEKYRQTDDRSIYDAYQTGALNVLDAYIQGLAGTKTAILENQELLKGKLSEYQDVWYEAVAMVASGYTFFDDFTSKDGKKSANVSFQLNILPSGLIDFSSLEHQIIEKVGAFKLNLQKFSDIAATFYSSLGTVLNEGELFRLILKQNVNKDIDEATARQYYREHIANNVSNRWYKAGWTEQQYVDFVLDKSNNGFGTSTKFGSTTVRSADERVQMRRTISGDSARAVTKATAEVKETAEKTAGTKTAPTTTSTTTTTSSDGSGKNTITPSGSQDAYASHYTKEAVRPAVVNINIGELAHFDHTAIASSAEERDLMAAMEERIATTVQRIVAVAANHAGGGSSVSFA